MKKFLAIIVAMIEFGSTGCASLNDTMTVHNQDASRIWFIQKKYGDNDKVIYCERKENGDPVCIGLQPQNLMPVIETKINSEGVKVNSSGLYGEGK